jgi:hypothetical protein
MEFGIDGDIVRREVRGRRGGAQRLSQALQPGTIAPHEIHFE